MTFKSAYKIKVLSYTLENMLYFLQEKDICAANKDTVGSYRKQCNRFFNYHNNVFKQTV